MILGFKEAPKLSHSPLEYGDELGHRNSGVEHAKQVALTFPFKLLPNDARTGIFS
jgi:hypothetical protein